MTEHFEIPPGRCREATWTAGARVQCAHLGDYEDDAFCELDHLRLRRTASRRVACRRTDGKCPHGDGPIPVRQGAE